MLEAVWGALSTKTMSTHSFEQNNKPLYFLFRHALNRASLEANLMPRDQHHSQYQKEFSNGQYRWHWFWSALWAHFNNESTKWERRCTVVATPSNNSTVAAQSTSADLNCNSVEIAWVDLLVNQETLIGEPENVVACITTSRVLDADRVRKINIFVHLSCRYLCELLRKLKINVCRVQKRPNLLPLRKNWKKGGPRKKCRIILFLSSIPSNRKLMIQLHWRTGSVTLVLLTDDSMVTTILWGKVWILLG